MSESALGLDYLDLEIIWSDNTPYGSTLSGRAQKFICERLHPRTTHALGSLVKHRQSRGLANSQAAVMVARERAQAVYERTTADPEFWNPPAALVRPSRLRLSAEAPGDSLEVPFEPSSLEGFQSLIAGREGLAHIEQAVRDVSDRVRAAGLHRERCPPVRNAAEALFLGHACVSWFDGEVRVWTDPFLRPKSLRYRASYQPILPADCPAQHHVVMLTHSHPDHFHPGTLMRFPVDTTFVVPEVPCESLLSIDIGLRLRQLGFHDVRALPWWETLALGRFSIIAVPFYGEQPLEGAAPVRAEFNLGNAYVLMPNRRGPVLLLADAGADTRGSAVALARVLKQRFGRFEAVFSNQSQWRMYPPQYLVSSVPEYLLFVPDDLMAEPQQIMLDSQQVARIADVLNAKVIVPYASGGAPWYEEMGLRPQTKARAHQSRHARAHLRPGDPLIASEARVVHLVAGDVLKENKGPRCASKSPMHSHAIRRKSPRSAMAYWQVSINSGCESLVRELSCLLSLDPEAFLVADRDFVEVFTSPGRGGDLLRGMLPSLLESGSCSYTKRSRPLTGQPFASERSWFRQFRRAFTQLRAARERGVSPTTALMALRRRSPYSRLPTALLVQVARSVCGIEGLSGSALERPRRNYVPRRASSLPLPRIAAPLSRNFGKASVTYALLWVKVAHITFWLETLMGSSVIEDGETNWFQAILAPRHAA